MPTSNPRINVTLPPSLDLLVERLAVLSRSSKSSVVRELLEAAEPALQRTVALMHAATRAHATWTGAFAADMEKAQAKATGAMGPLLQEMDDVTADLVRQAEAIDERRPARDRIARSATGRVTAAATAKTPVLSNRGVRTAKQAQTKGKPVGRTGRAL
jgi:hypothetical protein